ncbi:MBL fold metallo-hydrolase [Streptacidiphilus anmyonensis]|uniref:MBL fold metallo-hydrolase n=1 Tax=Streptacidiphilus anmyonensis TaxID=405782 RepID=UPI000693A5BF|nr:MBL fold metallo-hydrolase [Streptacidiphilus anmyonensis]
MSGLAPGILRIPTRGDGDNCFLVTDEDGLTLVDVGWKNAPTVIRHALEAEGRRLEDIRRIVITHAHPDHVRGLAELVTRTNADVLIHEQDAPWLAAGRVPRDGRSGRLGRTIDRVPLLHWQPVTATATVADGNRVGALRVIHTPGHSPGHIALLHEPSRALLVGDAVFHRGELATGPDALAADPAVRNASYARLPRDVTAVGFSHGAPLLGGETDHFATWLAGAADSAG